MCLVAVVEFEKGRKFAPQSMMVYAVWSDAVEVEDDAAGPCGAETSAHPGIWSSTSSPIACRRSNQINRNAPKPHRGTRSRCAPEMYTPTVSTYMRPYTFSTPYSLPDCESTSANVSNPKQFESSRCRGASRTAYMVRRKPVTTENARRRRSENLRTTTTPFTPPLRASTTKHCRWGREDAGHTFGAAAFCGQDTAG